MIGSTQSNGPSYTSHAGKGGFIQQKTENGKYHLGCQLIPLGTLALLHFDLRRLATDLLQKLLEEHQETVSLLRNRGFQKPIIIGGGQLSAEVCKYVGADHWTTDAVTGVELCKKLISGQVQKGKD